MQKVNMETYQQQPDRYELRQGDAPEAPLCPYGNQYQWLGFDKEQQVYVRFTKSVFKKLVQEKAPTRQ